MNLKDTILLAIAALERNGRAATPIAEARALRNEAFTALHEARLQLENAAEPATPAVGSIWKSKNGSRTLYEVREVAAKCLKTDLKAPLVIYSAVRSNGTLCSAKGIRSVPDFLASMTQVPLRRSDALRDAFEEPEWFRRNNGLAKKYKPGEAIDFSTLLDNFAHHVWADAREGVRVSDYTRAARQLFFNQEIREPIPMVLHCPSCGLQHVDAVEHQGGENEDTVLWNNPPHRSHLCHGCGTIWRPADVPTTGVEKIHTAGKNDTTKEAIAAGRVK